MFKNILFVCVGNICRSPLAEYWARAELQKSGLTDIYVFSAGLQAMQSAKIAEKSQSILNQFGIDAGQHVAEQIKESHMLRADIVFTMETWQKTELLTTFPNSRGKIFTLGKWNDEEIIDPYRQEQIVFDSVFELIKKNWNAWQRKLWSN